MRKKKGLLAALAAFASSPQGRKLIRQAKTYAQSPEGQRKLNQLRSKASQRGQRGRH
jgi:hypothetical protein